MESSKLFNSISSRLEHGSVHSGDDIELSSFVQFGIPTGIPELDYYLGHKGGYPSGKIIELYGLPASGKSTAALQAVVEFQRVGGDCLLIDTEYSYDKRRAGSLGVDTARLGVVEAESIEQIFNIINKTFDALEAEDWNSPFLIVVDSITGAPTEAELKTEISKESRVGQEARQIRRGMKPLISRLAKNQANLIFVNHAIARMAANPYAKQTGSAGGNAIKFYSWVRIEFKTVGKIKGEGSNTRKGQNIELFIEKFKGEAIQTDKFKVEFLDSRGFNSELGLLNIMIETGLFKQKGRFITGTVDEEEIQFSKGEWEQVLGQKSWRDMYKVWKAWAIEQGIIIPWGVV